MDLQNLIAFLTQKALPPLVGLCFAWMGYRLIVRGFLQEEGDRRQDLVMPASRVRVNIYRSSPGILFTIFGAALIAIEYPVALGIFFQLLAIAAGAGFGLMGFQLFAKGYLELTATLRPSGVIKNCCSSGLPRAPYSPYLGLQ